MPRVKNWDNRGVMTVDTREEADVRGDWEGDDGVSDGLDAYPLDSLLIRTEQRTIVDVLRRIENGRFKLNPDFQRDFVWDKDRQSRFVESILMRIPLPVFYVAEDLDGTLVVVDGLQRLTTLLNFKRGDLKLALRRPELAGLTLESLPPRLSSRFEDGQLQFYIIDSKAPERVRLDIFDRVNSGVPLTRQQMRNALYSGPATRLIHDLADSQELGEATRWFFDKPRFKTGAKDAQKDREAVNRFLAFYVLGWKSYGTVGHADMDEFLAKGLRAVNSMSDEKREELRRLFLQSMTTNHEVFGRHAFCKHESPDDRKKPLNLALFEVFSVLLAMFDAGLSRRRAQRLRNGFYKLIGTPRFLGAITAATTAPESVQARFDLAFEMVKGVLGDP